MPPTADNPAGRLYLLMSQATRLANGNTGSQFPILLNYQPTDTINMHKRFAAVLSAIEETEQLLKTHDREVCDMFISDKASIITFFSLGITAGHDWNQYKTNYLKEPALKTLEFCSLTLSRVFGEKVATTEALTELEKQLNELYASVADSNLDTFLKAKILDGLNDVRNAIHEYRITGVKGVEKAISALGVMAASNADAAADSTDSQWPDIMGRLSKFIDSSNKIFSFWETTHPLREAARKLLAAHNP